MEFENKFAMAAGAYAHAVEQMLTNRKAFRVLKKAHDGDPPCIIERDNGLCDACKEHEERYNHKKLIAKVASTKRRMMNEFRKFDGQADSAKAGR